MADVLLVDDSKTMRMLIMRALRQAGYRSLTIEEAENGQDALQKIGAANPKLVLSDWNMPEMSGIEFLRKLRGSHITVPFGFITSEASKEIKNEAMNAGAHFLITKPFTSEAVQDALSPIFGEA